MAMTPYYESTTGTSKRVNYDGSVQFFPNQVRTVRNLYNVVSNKGNYRTTTSHSYGLERYSTYTGIRETILMDGEVESLSGPAIAGGANITYDYPLTFSSNRYDDAVSRLLDKVRSSDINLSEDLVQWRSVAKMVNVRDRAVSLVTRHVAKMLPISNRMVRVEKQLARSGRKFRRDRLIKEYDYLLTTASSLHLEFIYGWMPLATTVYGLAKQAVTPQAPGHFKIEAQSTYRSTIRISKPSVSGVLIPEVASGLESEFCRVVCYFSPVPSVLNSLNAISALNPALIAYTAIPYSHVFDWFVNLGGWMQNFETYLTHKNNFVDGYVLKGRQIAVTWTWRGEVPLTWPMGAIHRVNCTRDQLHTIFQRYRLTSLPVQIMPVVNINGLSPGRCVQAASLLAQLRPLDRLLKLGR